MTPVVNRWERYTTSRRYEPGDHIFNEGEPSDEMYIVKEGQLAIMKEALDSEPLMLAYRRTGDLMGEVSLLSDSPRTASAVAVKPTTLLTISRDDFWRLMREDTDFQQTVIHTLIDHLLVADESRMVSAVWERELFKRFSSLSTEHERMAELMQLRQETIRFIVHDLRNPLNLVLMTLSMIKATGISEEAARFVAMAEGGARRVLSLVETMLDLERLQDGDVALDFELLDIADLVKDVVDRIGTLARNSEVDLLADLPAGDLSVVAVDRGRIDRVLTNLVDNALKFTPPGGKVTVGVRQESDKLVCSVNDTGPGIPPEQRERVFDRFAQTEEGRKLKKGFGLGLSYCRSAIMAHGGRIWAEEGEDGRGTKLLFTLPLEQ